MIESMFLTTWYLIRWLLISLLDEIDGIYATVMILIIWFVIILLNTYAYNLAWLNVYYYYYLCNMWYVNLQRSYHTLCHFILLLLLHFPSLYFTSLCCIVVNSTFFQFMIIVLFFLFNTFPSYYSNHYSNNFCRNYHFKFIFPPLITYMTHFY